MSQTVSGSIFFVLFLPVLMNIILPLALLAGWSILRGIKHLLYHAGVMKKEAIPLLQ
jgi:hypothetical protein